MRSVLCFLAIVVLCACTPFNVAVTPATQPIASTSVSPVADNCPYPVDPNANPCDSSSGYGP